MKKFFIFIKNLFKKEQVTKHTRPLTDEQFNSMKVAKEKKMNSILDKVSKNGYDSLSQHEKNFLNNLSK